jgi:formylmethanofuran dehydrogenase subunit E
MDQAAMTFRPIGVISTPFRTLDECPRNIRKLDPPPLCRVRLEPEYVPGLLGIESFSHLILLYWLDRAGPAAMVFTPPFDTAPRGVFATRSPARRRRSATPAA